MNRPKPPEFFKDWKDREAIAESMIPLIGKLYRENNVSLYMYGRNLVNRSVIDIMKAHRFVRQIEHNELSVYETVPVIRKLAEMDLGPAHIDVGKLTVMFQRQTDHSLDDFLLEEVGNDVGQKRKPLPQPQDVVLYGFGRIGRLVARLLIEKAGGGDLLRLRAVVVRRGKSEGDLATRASLLRRDSVHGSFNGTIRVLEDQDKLICNGNEIQFIYANSPADVDYTRYGISDALIVDNTGAWRDREGLGQHLECPGVSRVLLTAPGKGDIPNIVFGVNHNTIDPEERILSAASCTTNAIVPVLRVLVDRYGIEKGHVETIHAYTNDQNLIDNYHKRSRRGRGAPLNMVLTETGAARAVAKAIPELEGKLTGNSIRVPTPNVSMAMISVQFGQDVGTEELNEFLRETALHSPLQQQIGYTISDEAASTDFVGSRRACIVDSKATITNGNTAVIYCWYDNEFGYSCQVVRTLEKIAGVEWRIYPQSV